MTVEGGARAPHVGDGGQDHDRLGDADEQGPRADGGAPPVRHALRAHRRGRAPAVARARAGPAGRRRDARPSRTAGHAHRDLLRVARRRERAAADRAARPRGGRRADLRAGRPRRVPVSAPRRRGRARGRHRAVHAERRQRDRRARLPRRAAALPGDPRGDRADAAELDSEPVRSFESLYEADRRRGRSPRSRSPQDRGCPAGERRRPARCTRCSARIRAASLPH